MVNPHIPNVKGDGCRRLLRPVGNLWRFRRLVKELGVREFRTRFVGSVLGGAWALIEPAVQFLLYLVVFAYFLGMRLEEGAPVGSYGLFLVSGLVPFQALQDSVIRATGLIRSQAQLVRHVNVPIEVLLAGTLIAGFARHGILLFLALVAAILVGTITVPGLLCLAGGVALVLAYALAAGLLLAPAGAFLPDLARVVETLSMVLFFASPVVYPEEVLPAGVARWLPLNPVVGVLGLFRAALLGRAVDPLATGISVLVVLVLFGCGVWVFSCRHRAVRDLA